MTDWATWLAGYDDPATLHAQRLPVVRRLIDRAIAEQAGDQLQVLSLCAGDGRDLLPVLADWHGRRRIAARLVELTPALADRARAFSAEHGLDVEVVTGDAASAASYAGVVPADIVLVCGIFGNISDVDVRRTIGVLPALCRDGGHVVWTRHRRAPDLTPAIRSWLVEAGFAECAFESPGPDGFAVGLHRRDEPVFTFLR